MATILPFKGIRPARDKAHLVASRSVDTYGTSDLQDKLASNPYTFLHIINPDFHDGEKTIPGSPERLGKVKARYEHFLKDKILVRDDVPGYYVYRQQHGANTFTGIIACTAIDDYLNGVIKIHEQTITEREEKLMHYLEVCDFNAEPVLFCYPNDQVIDQITASVVSNEPIYDFSTTDKCHHQLWLLTDVIQVKVIQNQFNKIPAVYIADGHHRSASSTLLGKNRRLQKPDYTGKEAFNYYLGVFFPENQLKIYDFNRVVKDLNGLSESDLLKKLESSFVVENKGSAIYVPTDLHNFSMYLNSTWYSLTAREAIKQDHEPVHELDSYILTSYVLSPVLGLHDLKTDKRISFVPGVKGHEELKRIVDSGKAKVAFGLYPVSMQQLKHIADTGSIMPPKTTYVEPKMRSGLVIYSLADQQI